MTADKLANAILNKCDIYYGEALVSKEAIIEKWNVTIGQQHRLLIKHSHSFLKTKADMRKI